MKKRLCSLLTALCLVLTLLPAGALATETDNAVARIGDDTYDSLQGAYDAANDVEGTVIEMIADDSSSASIEWAKKQVTLQPGTHQVPPITIVKTYGALNLEGTDVFHCALTNNYVLNIDRTVTVDSYTSGSLATVNATQPGAVVVLDSGHDNPIFHVTDQAVSFNGQSYVMDDAAEALSGSWDNGSNTLTLGENLTITASFAVLAGDITLDLNGHTVSGSIRTMIAPAAGTSLTITDGSPDHTGTIQNSATGSKKPLGGDGAIIVEGGTITSNGDNLYADSDGSSLTVHGGTLNGNVGINWDTSAVTFTGGTLNGTITRNKAGAVTITGGKFSSDVTQFLASGYVQAGDGTVMQPQDPVAAIGDETYATLSDALSNAGDGDTVALLRDTEQNSRVDITTNLTLDLGGHTLSSNASHTFVVSAGQSFTVKNGTLKNLTGTAIFGLTGSTITLEKDAVMEVYDGIVATNNKAEQGQATIYVYGTIHSSNIAIWGQGPSNTVHIEGADITANYFAIYQNGSFGGSSYTIQDSTIVNGKDGGPAIYISNSKSTGAMQTLTVENSFITGETGIEVKYTHVTIRGEDTSIVATGTPPDTILNNNGSSSNGYALASTHNGKDASADGAAGILTIEGGVFTGLVGIQSPVNGAESQAELTITGGTFSSDPTEYLAQGYKVLEADGKYVVVPTTVTVTFDANGGSVTPANAATNESGKLDSLPTPTRSGYTFSGWFTAANGGTKVTTDTVFTDDTTVYAQWTVVQSGGSGGGSSSGGGGSSSGDKTETVTHPDGSTTTTVTKPNGTVTETTKQPDGSQQVVESQKDGTVTTTNTDADGNRTETVSRPDGSATTTVERTDGSTSTTAVDDTGKAQTQVTLPQSVVESAGEDQAVALPMPVVPVTSDRESAATVTVTLPGNTTAKVEIPVEDPTPGTVAVIVRADGTEEVVKTSLTTENGVTVTLSDGDTVKIVDNSKSFLDVDDTHWASGSIDFATSRELFSGTGADTFSPDVEMTRAMVVTVLARYVGEDTSTGGTWYEAGRQWAVEAGISDGTGMDDSVTREQLVTMLYRFLGQPKTDGDFSAFRDGDAVSPWAADAMAWAVSSGILDGMGDGSLAPRDTATRAQVAAVLARFVAET